MSRQARLVHVAVGIIKRGETILIAERPEGTPYAGYWEFPGGKIEQQESGEEALKRELYEELGIVISPATALFEHTYQYPDKTVRLEIWLVDQFEGEPYGKEGQKLCFVTLDDIHKFNLLEGNWPILERIKAILEV